MYLIPPCWCLWTISATDQCCHVSLCSWIIGINFAPGPSFEFIKKHWKPHLQQDLVWISIDLSLRSLFPTCLTWVLARTVTLCVLWSYVRTVHTVQSDQTSRLSVRWHNNFFSSCRQCGCLCHDHAAATENRTKQALQNTPAWHSMLSKAIWRTERMLMRAENNLAYPAPSTDVLCCCSGEGWEVRGERRGGRVWCCRGGACLWMMALSLIRAPAAPDAHTHICWHSCVSTLYALTYSTSVPPSSSHFSLFSTKTFSLFDASIIHSFFMQVLHVFARSVLRSQSDIYPVGYTHYDAWQIAVYTATSLRLVDDATLNNNNSTWVEADKSCRAPQR